MKHQGARRTTQEDGINHQVSNNRREEVGMKIIQAKEGLGIKHDERNNGKATRVS